MAGGPTTSWQINGEESGDRSDFIFLVPKSMRMVTAVTNFKKNPVPWKKSSDKPRQCIKKQRHHFVDKGPYSQSYGFSSSHVWMCEFGRKEGWAPKN